MPVDVVDWQDLRREIEVRHGSEMQVRMPNREVKYFRDFTMTDIERLIGAADREMERLDRLREWLAEMKEAHSERER